MPDDSDVYLRIAQITASCISSINAKKISSRPGSTPRQPGVMLQRGMLYQAQGRYEDAIRVLSVP